MYYSKKIRFLSSGAAVFIAATIFFASDTSHGQVQNSPLGECMAQETTGADREHFAKWIFSVLSQHPIVSENASFGDVEKELINRKTALLMTRLIGEDCAAEARASYNAGGVNAIATAYRVMGRVAVQELFRNDSVVTYGRKYWEYIEDDSFGGILE